MKKGFLTLLLLATVGFSVAPSYALFGVDDKVVGYDIMVPFFLVSIDGSMDTVITITETGQTAVTFHWLLYSKRGVLVADGSIPLTRSDVASLSVKTLIGQYVSSAGLEELRFSLGGADHYVGYMVFENQNSPAQNHVIASAFFLDGKSGINAGINLPVREVDESGTVTDSKLINPVRRTEYFSANALFRAQQYITLQGTSGSVANATYFALTPRYYLHNANSENYFFIWMSSALPRIDLYCYDEAENGYSTFMTFPDPGLNIIDLRESLPSALLHPYPAAGWVSIRVPDIFGQPSTIDGDREMLGYSFEMSGVVGGVPPDICADVTEEGQVSINDAMFIAQFLAGNRTCICSGTPSQKCDPAAPAPAFLSGVVSLTEMYRYAGSN